MVLHNYIRRRLYDDNPNFVPNDIVPNIVARSRSHENCSLCRMNFIYDRITDNLMEQ